MEPKAGPHSKSALMSIFGGKFLKTNEVKVKFFTKDKESLKGILDTDLVVPATVKSENLIQCFVPPVPKPQELIVAVALNSYNWFKSPVTYQIYGQCILARVV